MPRHSTDYDKLVSKHYGELSAALESIRRQLKPAYMWELTAENCHQIYSRLLKIEPFSGEVKATGDNAAAAAAASSVASPWLTVIELHPHNNSPQSAEESGTAAEGGSLAFFGSIPLLLSNINSLLAELQPTTADDGAPNSNHGRNNQDGETERRKNKAGEEEEEVFESVDSGERSNSFFIDVSRSATVPRIMQDEETVALKCVLLRLRDYLRANTDAHCLNANDCLRTMSASGSTTAAASGDGHCPWDLCFLSGVLLGYPVILCNSTPDDGNCLAHQSLVNYCVTMEEDQRHHNFPLYSFSVPQCFQEQFSRRISRWFEELRQKEERLRLRQTVERHPLILT